MLGLASASTQRDHHALQKVNCLANLVVALTRQSIDRRGTIIIHHFVSNVIFQMPCQVGFTEIKFLFALVRCEREITAFDIGNNSAGLDRPIRRRIVTGCRQFLRGAIIHRQYRLN